jgi:hypothetical protein
MFEYWAAALFLPSIRAEETSTDWIAFTPEGYYWGSAGASRFIEWQVDQAHCPAAAYEGVFHRPDQVRQGLRETGSP